LEARGLSFSYKDGFALKDVSLRVVAGERVALLGPNGAGKSTLLKLLAGILAPTEGSLTGGGARRVAWVPQEMDALFPISVDELVGMGFFPRSARGGWIPPAGAAETMEKLLAQLALTELRRRDVRTLSGGERRRALLARGLAQGARVLLLDEPTAHLDPRHQAEFAALLHDLGQSGISVVAALHDLNLALETADRAVLLAEGAVVAQGAAKEVLIPALLEKAYGLPARLTPGIDGNAPTIRFSKPLKENHP
jgi:iron complex transport system ATP-binding protein